LDYSQQDDFLVKLFDAARQPALGGSLDVQSPSGVAGEERLADEGTEVCPHVMNLGQDWLPGIGILGRATVQQREMSGDPATYAAREEDEGNNDGRMYIMAADWDEDNDYSDESSSPSMLSSSSPCSALAIPISTPSPPSCPHYLLPYYCPSLHPLLRVANYGQFLLQGSSQRLFIPLPTQY
jgi:hypothetical protein